MQIAAKKPIHRCINYLLHPRRVGVKVWVTVRVSYRMCITVMVWRRRNRHNGVARSAGCGDWEPRHVTSVGRVESSRREMTIERVREL